MHERTENEERIIFMEGPHTSCCHVRMQDLLDLSEILFQIILSDQRPPHNTVSKTDSHIEHNIFLNVHFPSCMKLSSPPKLLKGVRAYPLQ